MRKFLLTLLVGLLCIPLQMSALTADDLDGWIVGQIAYGSKMMSDMPYGSYGGKFQKVNSNTLRLINFLGQYDVDFTISGTTLTMKSSQAGISYTNKTTGVSAKFQSMAVGGYNSSAGG